MSLDTMLLVSGYIAYFNKIIELNKTRFQSVPITALRLYNI